MQNSPQQILSLLVRAWNEKDWPLLRSLHADDWVDRSEGVGVYGLPQMEAFFNQFTFSFPDMQMDIIHAVYGENDIAYYHSLRATMQNDFMGFKANGQEVNFTAAMILGLEAGKIKEAWGMSDKSLFFHQMRSQKTKPGN